MDIVSDLDQEMEEEVEEEDTSSTEDYNLYWQYMVGMLTNLGPLDINRIATMLEMFVSEKTFTGDNRHQLKEFLDSKVRNSDLIFSLQSGVYSLPQ
ncbi:hypothetical protein BB561_004723 [Smittium simulii]|uniref:Anaphase-promoting complex subunit 2 C-terminal domain-containing protein n=1 Tax=Smittium simulii TaxID=133385 RepID=A0A2T9YEP2_9FUNG|nr:hypothetical protein BB561_004723 [Smittium simulii]